MQKVSKYNKLSINALILILAAFITSCEYQPTKEYRVDLTKPTEAPLLDVDLDLMTDTINFYWESSINLKINTENLRLLSVKCYLDNSEINGNNNDTIFNIILNFNQPGIHKFKMTIVTNSGTNSIADRLGAEGFQYESREWTLIAKTPDLNSNITYQLYKNGLSLSWKEYDGTDFKGYRLKDISTGNIYDIQTTSFQNTSYVGEEGHYYLYVLDNRNNEHLWGRCILNKSLPVLKLGNIDNRIALIWNRTIFKNNITEYQVFQGDWWFRWTKIGTLSNNDTSVFIRTTNNVFAERVSFYLYCVPKQYSVIGNTSLFSSFLQNGYAALPGPRFESNFGVSCSCFYFDTYSTAWNKSILYRYSITTDKVNMVMDYNMFSDISPNAKYLLIPVDSILDLYDLNTNKIIKSINIKKVANGFYPAIYPKISDNGICVFISNNVLYVYDILNDKLIAAKTLFQAWVKISPKGKYISVDKTDSLIIYRINENSVSFQSGLKKSGGVIFYRNYNFCLNQEDYLYLYQSPDMYVRSCQDLSIIRRMNIGSHFFNIDFCFNKILTSENAGTWNIYDFNTGNLLQSINTNLGAGGSNYTLLTNNTIYYTGYKYFLGN